MNNTFPTSKTKQRISTISIISPSTRIKTLLRLNVLFVKVKVKHNKHKYKDNNLITL